MNRGSPVKAQCVHGFKWLVLGLASSAVLVLGGAGCSDDEGADPDSGGKDSGVVDSSSADVSDTGAKPDASRDAAGDSAKVADAKVAEAKVPDAVVADAAGPDAGPPPASATFGSAGGSISVPLAGLITRVRLDLPAKTLSATEKVKLTLIPSQTLPKDHPTIGGAVHGGGFSLDVDPASLRKKVELALRLRVTFAGAALPAAQRKEAFKDALTWSERHMLATFRDAQVKDTAAVALCKYSPPTEHAPLRIDWVLFEKKVYRVGTELAYTVELAGPFLLVSNRYGLGQAYRPTGLKGAKYRLWRTLLPMHKPFEMTPHKHIGPVVFRYFPISVGLPGKTGYAPNKPWPAKTGDQNLVKSCLGSFISKALDPLAKRTFDTLRWPYPFGYSQWHNVLNKKYNIKGKYGGNFLPYVVFIYDYSTSPDVAATTNMWLRTMRLPTKVVDPAMYSASTCFTAKAKDLVASVGHEVFHWQQGAYLMPQTAGKLDPAYYAFFHQTKTFNHGPHTLTSWMTFFTHEWIYEGTAQYFDSVFVRQQGYWTRRGLASYPLERPPWRLSGGKVWAALHEANTYWSYYRYFFFKYLFDQEKGGAKDELTELKTLLQDLQKEQKAKGAGAKYTPVVKAWMDHSSRKLTWFGWLREFLLLRGCSLAGKTKGCTEVPKAMTFPFAYSPSGGADPFGKTETSDHWTSFIPPVSKRWEVKLQPYTKLPPGFNPARWKASGRTISDSKVCNFDSNEPAYQKTGIKDEAGVVVPDAMTILKSGPKTITLPQNVQFHLSGARLDILDNTMPAKSVSKHQWTITRSASCAKKLELEAYTYSNTFGLASKSEPLRFRKRTTGTTLVFDVPVATGPDATSRLAWVYLLAGNNSWTADAAKPTAKCTIQVSIKAM